MKSLYRLLALVLSLSLSIIPVGQAHAAMVSNAQLMQHMQQLNSKEILLERINRSELQQQLSGMGVSAADVEHRINQMTMEEVALLNQQLDELPAGGDVLGIIVLLFLVFVVTDVIGATDIFPFIHPVN